MPRPQKKIDFDKYYEYLEAERDKLLLAPPGRYDDILALARPPVVYVIKRTLERGHNHIQYLRRAIKMSNHSVAYLTLWHADRDLACRFYEPARKGQADKERAIEIGEFCCLQVEKGFGVLPDGRYEVVKMQGDREV